MSREDTRNYPKSAWQKLAQSGGVAESAGAYVERTDDAGRPIPHVCFKVPTGGGKTLLAAAALMRLGRQTGLTLWITPTRAIYEQTKAALRNREHPYRQMLEIASGGRVKFMEKDDPLTASDVANYLCVMLLSLPATNRNRNRDFLRMFRDTGRYPTLFPDDDDALGDARLLNSHPDLERASENGHVKHSLFNVFKILRPVVVLDEAHKAYGSKKQEANEEFVRMKTAIRGSSWTTSATSCRELTGRASRRQTRKARFPIRSDSSRQPLTSATCFPCSTPTGNCTSTKRCERPGSRAGCRTSFQTRGWPLGW